MNSATPKARPVALTIAGSDSGGGAGIQADLKTFTRLKCFGASAITAITAQNTQGVDAVRLLEPKLVIEQIDSIVSDLQPKATKTGMLGSAAMVEAVAGAVKAHALWPLVVDPVMIAKSGDSLIDDAAIDALLNRLLPLATIVTPNRFEAARLVGFPVETIDQATEAARRICSQFGAFACVVKTIRQKQNGQSMSVDVFYEAGDESPVLLPHRWHAEGQPNTHGSGCTFSAALTALIARKRKSESYASVVERAVQCIDQALASPVRLGRGISPVDHLAIRG